MESSDEGKPTAGKVCDGKDIDSVDRSSADNSNESSDKSTKDIILSLTDPTYKEVMHKYFKKLGSKTNPNPHITDAIAAQEVLDMFKNKEGKFLKLKNPRSVEGGYVEVDDDEALDSEYDIHTYLITSRHVSVRLFEINLFYHHLFIVYVAPTKKYAVI